MPNSRSTPLERLADDEVCQHIEVAYAAINDILSQAAQIPATSADFAHLRGPRYSLVLSSDKNEIIRGIGTLHDLRQNTTHSIRVCFGCGSSNVQLRREFFEDVSGGTQVRVKRSSHAPLFRAFVEFLKDQTSGWLVNSETRRELAAA